MDWKETLKSRGYLLSDGAWGTQLAARGLPAGLATELWNAEHPEAVEAVARAYVDAGSDVILTNTFGGSPLKLARMGLGDRCEELNRLGAQISRRAAADRALVFASIGPTGEFMAPLGEKTEADFVDAFARQIDACLAGGADGVVIETMTDLAEAIAALKAARRAGCPTVVVSMTFDRTPRGFATMMGVTPERAARDLQAAGADMIGANCGAGIDNMIEIARALRAATRLPLWMKPNAGIPQLIDGKTVFRETPADMAAKVESLFLAGANVVGGCCGTTPEHIRAMGRAAEAARETAMRASGPVLADL